MANEATEVAVPQVVVIAGPNGAGKTSAAPDLLRDAVGIEAFVNADVIASGLAGFRPESTAFEAGRIMLGRLHALAKRRSDIAFESTLAGRAAYRLLTQLAKDGYQVHIFYLWLRSADLAVARVRGRVRLGGHDVPEADIRRRFPRSLTNFDRLYRPIVTTWRVYDGSAMIGRPLIAHGGRDQDTVVLDSAVWDTIRRQIAEAQ